MITYIITPYNRSRQTYYTLARLGTLTLPDEVMVINDGWTDELDDFLKLIKYPITYIKRPRKDYDCSAIPRNIGVKQAKGDYVLVCDPECLFVSDVVAQMKQQMALYPEKVIIAGTCYFTSPKTHAPENELINNPRGLLESWDKEGNLKQFPFHKEDRFDKDGKEIIFTDEMVMFDHKVQATFCALFKKEWLLEVGGWDEDMAIINGGGGWGFDDIWLLARLAQNGHPQIGIPEIEVIHQYHQRPPQAIADGWKRNEDIMKDKQNSSPGVPYIVVNRGKEWGKI